MIRKIIAISISIAIAGTIASNLAVAAPSFKSARLNDTGLSYTYSGQGLIPIALLDDGQVIFTGPVSYGPDNCPVATSPDQTMCTPLVNKETLALVSPTQPAMVLPLNVLNKEYRINHLGQMALWDYTTPQTMTLVDLHTSTPTPFSPNSLIPPACLDNNINAGLNLPMLSDANQLLWVPSSNCSSASGVYLWSTNAQSHVSNPTGYTLITVASTNTSGQFAVTASLKTTVSPASTRAFIWNGTKYKVLSPPFLSLISGYSSSEAVAMNDAGTVAGNLVKRDGSRHAGIWHGTKSTNIGTLANYTSSVAMAIGPNGVVLACAYSDPSALYSGGDTTMFLWNNGVKQAWTDAVSSADGVTPSASCSGMYGQYEPHALRLISNRVGQWVLRDPYGVNFLISPIQ